MSESPEAQPSQISESHQLYTSRSDGDEVLNRQMGRSTIHDRNTSTATNKRSLEEQEPLSSAPERPTKQPFHARHASPQATPSGRPHVKRTQTAQSAANVSYSTQDNASRHPTSYALPSHDMPDAIDTKSALAQTSRSSPLDQHQPASPSSDFLKQPATRPISEAQLINEVKGIYAGLVMVEKKCVEIVTQQSQSNKRLDDPQWKALVALHRTLLQEHHDFFSASQHPTASDNLKKLAVKYAMPARMWRHGIHAFLELLRHRLPGSMEHMLSFIYLSYSMMALLKESVQSFEETWIECLGDLARYRMAIEDSDPRDREIWSNVARMWYNEAADKSPHVGRIQHHLAVLARPNIVEQLFYYSKALISVQPFPNAKESIMLLFDLPLKNNDAIRRYATSEAALVHGAAILFVKGSVREYYRVREQFRSSFAGHLDRMGPKMKVQGPQIAGALEAILLGFGSDDNPLWRLCRRHADRVAAEKKRYTEEDTKGVQPLTEAQIRANLQREEFDHLKESSKVDRVPPPPGSNTEGNVTDSDTSVALAGLLFQDAVSICASKIGDKNVVPFMHRTLAFLWALSHVPGALVAIEHFVPWRKVVQFLNTIGRSGISYNSIESPDFPQSSGGLGRQLPDDFLFRGYDTSQYYYPPGFWGGTLVDDDERNVELPSHQAPRAERCLWAGIRLASLDRHLLYDEDSKMFKCTLLAESFAITSQAVY